MRRTVVVGHGQRHVVRAGRRVGLARAGRRRRGRVAEIPAARRDRAVAVARTIRERGRQAAHAEAEVRRRRHVGAAAYLFFF